MMVNMFRSVLLLQVFTLLLLVSGCGKADEFYNVGNENRIILRLAETQPSGYPSSQGAREFARLVEQRSGGKIKVIVYDSGKLGDESSVVEQVQFGGIDLARVSLASLAKYSPEINILTLPYIFRNSDHMWRVLQGPVGVKVTESLLKEKITCLSWYEGGAIGFYNSKRPINSMEDFAGLKISVQQSQMVMDMYSRIGISLVSTKATDLYSALQAGAIDGVEGNIVTYHIAKHYQVAKYLTYDAHARIPEVIIGSRVTMLQLSKNDQALIVQAAKDSAALQKQSWLELEGAIVKGLEAEGVQVVYDTTRNSLLAAVKPFYDGINREELYAVLNY